MTFDQLAARQLLMTGRVSPGLVRQAAIATGSVCPECDSIDTEDNGRTEYRCRCCDHRWGNDGSEIYGY